MRGTYETTTVGQVSPLSIAGAIIRYGFYAVGAIVLAIVGIGILSVWKMVPKAVDDPPAFRIADGEFANKPVSGHIISSQLGRAEVRQYGQLHSRSNDLAVVMVMPPRGIGMGTQLVQDLNEANLLRLKRAIMTQTHYDLDTRFGEFRATEMRVDTDGRWKQCLAYRSRLQTASVYFIGWYCDGSGSRPSRKSLACILDKLVLERELASKEARWLPARAHDQGGILPSRTGDANHRYRTPRRVAAVALVAAERIASLLLQSMIAFIAARAANSAYSLPLIAASCQPRCIISDIQYRE